MSMEKDLSNDPYPWLKKDDPKRNIRDREMLKNVSLQHCCLIAEEKVHLDVLQHKDKDSLSLKDKIGNCPNV